MGSSGRPNSGVSGAIETPSMDERLPWKDGEASSSRKKLMANLSALAIAFCLFSGTVGSEGTISCKRSVFRNDNSSALRKSVASACLTVELFCWLIVER